jgi:hypothetical protein
MRFDAASPILPIATLAAGVFLMSAADHELLRGCLPYLRRSFRTERDLSHHQIELVTRDRANKENENQMKETTLSKITASVRVAKGMAERVLAASPNPQWTEYELQTIDEWIARQGVKLDRSEAIRRLVELGLRAKGK